MQKIYSRIDWKNFPSEETAVNETNLNRMDSGLDAIDIVSSLWMQPSLM
jgi:hypothetical protein